jgi:transcriptional regulator with GAF, ATPase, and Fis domain
MDAQDHDRERPNVVPLPFLVAASVASAPALGRFGPLYGSSDAMQEVYQKIEKVARTDATVLVTGESGGGKELVARTIHERGRRSRGPFVAINCGAIPSNLIEAELFGHEKGAFTGATRSRGGCFERAEGGTLLLDEITEMSLDMQVRLLRVLETGRYSRVGGDTELRADVRIVAATNRDPHQRCATGACADLMYRPRCPACVAAVARRDGDAEPRRAFLERSTRNRARHASRAPRRHLRTHQWPATRGARNAVHARHGGRSSSSTCASRARPSRRMPAHPDRHLMAEMGARLFSPHWTTAPAVSGARSASSASAWRSITVSPLTHDQAARPADAANQRSGLNVFPTLDARTAPNSPEQ